MFGKQTKMSLEHETLKENHETLVKDYEYLEERLKLEEETYELFKVEIESKNKQLEKKNASLLEDCVRERTEKEKLKKVFEEMKKSMEDERNEKEKIKKIMEDERNEKEKFKKMYEDLKTSLEDKGNAEIDAEIDALKKINLELKLVNKKEGEQLERMENKFVELAKKFCVVEAECTNLCFAEVAGSGTLSAVMSGIGETENLIGQGENEVNHNANNGITGEIVISDESDAENENPPRGSNISSHQSAGNKQEEQGRNTSNENRAASGEIFTPRSTNHGAAFTAPSSSSSSSSDSSEVPVKLPPNWPEWRKGPGNGSNKS